MEDRGALEAAKHGQIRSPHWHSVMEAFLAANPICAACKEAAFEHIGHQVHHCFPFHICIAVGRPDLELDPRNLVTLGETEKTAVVPDHHLLLGHLGDFKSYNTSVAKDCVLFRGMTTEAIKADSRWQARERHRPLDQLGADDLKAFRAQLDQLLPPDPVILKKYGLKVNA